MSFDSLALSDDDDRLSMIFIDEAVTNAESTNNSHCSKSGHETRIKGSKATGLT